MCRGDKRDRGIAARITAVATRANAASDFGTTGAVSLETAAADVTIAVETA